MTNTDLIIELEHIRNYSEKNECLYYNNKLLKYIGLKNVKTLTINANEISANAFEGLKIDELIFSKGVESISNNAFKNSEIEKIQFPSTIKELDLSKQEITTKYFVFDNEVDTEIINKSRDIYGEMVFLKSEYEENIELILKKIEKSEALYQDKKYEEALNGLYEYCTNNDILKLIYKCEQGIYSKINDEIEIKKDALSKIELEKYFIKIKDLKKIDEKLKNNLLNQINELIKINDKNEKEYNEAVEYFDMKKYFESYYCFKNISPYKNSSVYIMRIKSILEEKFKLDFQTIDNLEYIKEVISELDLYDDADLKTLKMDYVNIEKNVEELLSLKEAISQENDVYQLYNKLLIVKENLKVIKSKFENDIISEIIEISKKVIIDLCQKTSNYKEMTKLINCLIVLKPITDVSACLMIFKNKLQVNEKFTYNDKNILNDKIDCLANLNILLDVNDLIIFNKNLKEKIIKSFNTKNAIKVAIKTIFIIGGIIALILLFVL